MSCVEGQIVLLTGLVSSSYRQKEIKLNLQSIL